MSQVLEAALEAPVPGLATPVYDPAGPGGHAAGQRASGSLPA
jgi:hypothetical protein